ncbi:hypothetical protein DFH11DRAFT_1503114 [Phellopilus nigrolimitatus]|nr:hypothetical protein DFH11DRAFT_1503114 [Phellopilus nigrolimitatus]
MATYASAKRARQDQFSASSSRSPSPTTMPTSKAQRVANRASRDGAPLLCTLPPTCHPPHNAPTALANSQELEAHYAKYHAHVCEERGCAAVFPNARLLELHQAECHDPLALVRKERGEKIFACHLETCPRLFLNPKKRRLHLIQAHGFPKEYFFAVTNKGVGGLLKKWGEGASLIRGSWKARSEQVDEKSAEGMEVEDEEDSDDDTDESKDEEKNRQGLSRIWCCPLLIRVNLKDHPRKQAYTIEQTGKPLPAESTAIQKDTFDALANSMNSLSLVPTSIRFGRGGKSGQVVRQAQDRDGSSKRANHVDDQAAESSMDAEATMHSSDEDISINIDAALEALKVEASATSAVKQSGRRVLQNGDIGSKSTPVLGGGRGRGRGGRGSGRGRGRGQSRNRGCSSVA